MIDVTKPPFNVPIDGTDASVSLQAALNSTNADLYFPSGTSYLINGLKIPSGKRLHMNGAIFVTPSAPRMSAFETVVGSSDIRIFGGRIAAMPAPVGVLGGVGFRGNDCADLRLVDVDVEGWPLDCAYFGGNTGCKGLRLELCSFEGAKRNCVSVTNAEDVCFLDCEFSDTFGDNPGAGCDVESNPGERTSGVVFASCLFVRCFVGLYIQRGKGFRGDEYLVANSKIVDCRKYGMVLSELRDVRVVNNTVYNCPTGISAGSATEGMRTSDLSLLGNTLTACPTPLVMAGLREGQVVGNLLSGGIRIVGLGVDRDMIFLRNENILTGGPAPLEVEIP